MIATMLTAIGDARYTATLTLILGALYAAVWFGLGGLWTIRMVRRGRLVIPPD